MSSYALLALIVIPLAASLILVAVPGRMANVVRTVAVIAAPPPTADTSRALFSSSPARGRCGSATKIRSSNASPTVSSSMRDI